MGEERATGGVLPDWLIEREIHITPFNSGQVQEGVISYGLGSYGYDVRAGYKFKVFTDVWGCTVDPKNFDPKSFVDVDITPPTDHDWGPEVYEGSGDGPPTASCRHCGFWRHDSGAMTAPNRRYKCMAERTRDHIVIPPNSFALAETIEYVEIPRDILAIAIGKSTYARCGIIIPMTPLEPAWKGKITVEISNTTPLPAKVYAGEGIIQIIFLQGVASCRVSYADKKGRYQDQTGLTLPFVRGKTTPPL